FFASAGDCSTCLERYSINLGKCGGIFTLLAAINFASVSRLSNGLIVYFFSIFFLTSSSEKLVPNAMLLCIGELFLFKGTPDCFANNVFSIVSMVILSSFFSVSETAFGVLTWFFLCFSFFFFFDDSFGCGDETGFTL